MRSIRGVIVGAVLATVGGCETLIGPEHQCTDQIATQANREEYHARGCRPYRCSAEDSRGRIFLETIGAEVPSDGFDNDCDGRVDEGSWRSPEREVNIASTASTASQRVTWTTPARSGEVEQLRVILADTRGTAYSTDLGVPSGESRDPISVGLNALPFIPRGVNELPAGASTGEMPVNCPICQGGMVRIGICRARDLVAAQRGDGSWFLAATDEVGGERGRLRIGSATSERWAFEQDVRSSTGAGIGVTVNGDRCLLPPSDAAEVSRIAIAASSSVMGAGLLVWVASQRPVSACASSENPSVRVSPVSSSGEGILAASHSSSILASTTGEGGRPVIVSLQGAVGRRGGFLVAFGEGAAVNLCLLREWEDRCALHVRIPSLSGNVQQVAASLGEVQADHSTTVGITWTSGCGTAVQFASIAFNLEGDGSERLQVRTPAQLVASAQGISWPSIAYSERAFRVDRTEVGTNDAGVRNREVNGWLVSWAEGSAVGSQVRALRIDADGVRSVQDDEQPRNVHVSHTQVTYHAIHRLVGRDGTRLVSFTATQDGFWFQTLY